MTVNYRKRVGIPHNVLGNLVALVAQPVDEVDEAADIAAGLRARLEQYADNYVDYQASMRVFEAHSSPGERLRIASRFFEPGRGDLLVTNWNNFGAYELKFGTSGPWLFVPLALGASKLPAWFMVVYDLPRLSGLGFAVGLPPAVAERWKKRVEPAIASRPVRAGTTTCIARTI
jgi:hypothetical protein